jgi:hypothetical protein
MIGPALWIFPLLFPLSRGFQLFISGRQRNRNVASVFLSSDDWSGFAALDYDDESVDTNNYAVEDDSHEQKARIGASREPPSIERPADPIQVPAGA